MELSITTTAAAVYRRHQPPHTNRRPSFKSINFPKLTTFSPIKSSFQTPQFTKPQNPNPTLAFLKTTVITGVALAAVFLSRPSLAAPPPPPPPRAAVEISDDEPTLEKTLEANPNDVNTIKALMEVKIKNGKTHEAIGLLNQLINLEPEDIEWELLKSHLHSFDGDHESAKKGFEHILSKDPFRVEAYHGLVMAASGKENPENEIKNVEKRILEAMEVCKKGKRKDEVRDFKLLLAQIRVIQGDYDSALRIYEELSKEEPRDFRPYLCQGIIYTLLGRNDEAEKMFGKYRRLVPKGHPYTKYFDDNLVATKGFAEKVESERAFAKS